MDLHSIEKETKLTEFNTDKKENDGKNHKVLKGTIVNLEQISNRIEGSLEIKFTVSRTLKTKNTSVSCCCFFFFSRDFLIIH